LFYAVCGIPIARWADRGVRRNIIALALATWSAMTAVSGLANTFWQLFLARVGVGVGEAGCLAPAQSMICDYVRPKQRGGIYALHTFGLLVGMMLGMTLAGRLGDSLGWRATFLVLGIPGVALAGLVRLTLREPTRGRFDAGASERSPLPLGSTLRELARCRPYRVIATFLAASGFVNFGLFQWWPSLFARVFGASVTQLGTRLGVAIAVGSGVGLLIGGVLSNKVASRDARLPLLIGAVTMALAIPTALGSLFSSSLLVSILLVGLTGLLWSVASGPSIAMLYSSLPPHMRATGGAISLFATAILGQGLGPFCVGWLSDVLGPTLGVDALRYALLAPVCVLPIMVITLWVAANATTNSGGADPCR
jgi:predicted MFS family arabinose efflux permease